MEDKKEEIKTEVKTEEKTIPKLEIENKIVDKKENEVKEEITSKDIQDLPNAGDALKQMQLGKIIIKRQTTQDVPAALPADSVGTKDVIMKNEVYGNIKELTIIMNTENYGYASYTTDVINGELFAVIFETTAPINAMIYFADAPNIRLLETRNSYINGDVYLPLRLPGVSPKYENYNFSQEKWCLNDKLTFEVLGTKNATIKIRMRYK